METTAKETAAPVLLTRAEAAKRGLVDGETLNKMHLMPTAL